MPRSFDFLADELDDLKQSSRLRRLIPRAPRGISFVESGKHFVNFGSNDYLGLAAENEATDFNVGSGASALVSGWTDQHQRLADQIALLEQTEAAVVFPSGYAACSGVVATLPGERDLILSDQLNHASLIDGCRLSRSERLIYPHCDPSALELLLKQKRDRYREVWIVTDGVFSMDGHVAPLVELCELADHYQSHLIVDEAHGTGVLGENGGGVCEALGVKSRVPIRVGTLSKAIGSQGGFVAGPQTVIDYLVNRCRTLIFSTSLSRGSVAAALSGLESIRVEPRRRTRVYNLARRVREQLAINVGEIESSVPIIPLIYGDDSDAVAAASRLAAAGFYVPAIRPPAVPVGTARLRLSLSAAHDGDSVDQLIRVLSADSRILT